MRLLLCPVIPFFIYVDHLYTRIIALILFIFTGATDIIDGYIARKYRLESFLGSFLDPLADKIMITWVFASFLKIKELDIPVWMVALIISREFLVAGLRTLAAGKHIVIKAEELAKFKTLSQIVAIIACMFIMIIYSIIKSGYFYPSMELQYILKTTPKLLTGIASFLSVYSGVKYFITNRNIF